MTERNSLQFLSRRDLLATGGKVLAATLLPSAMRGQANQSPVDEARIAADPLRPRFHLLPARNWMNDPNGPIFAKGHYHMFFQYNPFGATWGNMNWNHAVSRDMLHWTLLPVALSPTPGTADSFGCFSGSAIEVGKRVYIIYTGVRQATPEEATLKDGKITVQETQCLAYSDDPHLMHWTKLEQPVIAKPPAGMKVTGFRDPSIWKQSGWYFMTVGSGEEKAGGCVLLYRSKDLKNWEYLHKLTEGAGTGAAAVNPVANGEMWECPDFFALGRKHVLIYSTRGKVYWQSGVLNEETMKFAPEKTGLLDLGAFYAPKTQLDEKGQRILWGWIPERRSEEQMRLAGWSGLMSLPRILTLDSEGNLCMSMLPETAALRGVEQTADGANATSHLAFDEASCELLCDGDREQAFHLTVSDGNDAFFEIIYDPKQAAFLIKDNVVKIAGHLRPSIQVFIDGSVAEVLLSGQMSYTTRFYPKGTQHSRIDASITGTTLKGWPIKAISPDKLTTVSESFA